MYTLITQAPRLAAALTVHVSAEARRNRLRGFHRARVGQVGSLRLSGSLMADFGPRWPWLAAVLGYCYSSCCCCVAERARDEIEVLPGWAGTGLFYRILQRITPHVSAGRTCIAFSPSSDVLV